MPEPPGSAVSAAQRTEAAPAPAGALPAPLGALELGAPVAALEGLKAAHVGAGVGAEVGARVGAEVGALVAVTKMVLDGAIGTATPTALTV